MSKNNPFSHLFISLFIALFFIFSYNISAQGYYSDDLPEYLKNRGYGTPTSMFGTYIEKGELRVYPFFEYYLHNNEEYAPSEFGYIGDTDFESKFQEYEWLIFLGYGITDNLVIELEAAMTSATLEKADDDESEMPKELSDSGIGDVQTQINWRWISETYKRPTAFSYFEIVFPTVEEGSLIGTSDWEFKIGSGVEKGFKWGTLTGRASIEYIAEDSAFESGEFAVEYLKRLSQSWRIYAGIEGNSDELELITEAQWHLNDEIFIKLNNAFGLTTSTSNWAPEIGIMFSFK
ncbi:hypothetical protein ACFL4H_01010 [Candidatus Neomarinimicrobiota bacterium]